MFSPDLRYSKFTDCGSCSEYRRNIFKYRSYPKGLIIPRERCLQNTLYFTHGNTKSTRLITYSIDRQ